MLGNDDGNFFKVLTEMKANAFDSIKNGSKSYDKDDSIICLPNKKFKSFIKVRFLIPPPVKIHLSILAFIFKDKQEMI